MYTCGVRLHGCDASTMSDLLRNTKCEAKNTVDNGDEGGGGSGEGGAEYEQGKSETMAENEG